jgi:signal transduction histidine kinase
MPPPTANQSLALHGDLLRQVENLQREVAGLRGELERAEQLATLGTLGAMVAHEVNNLMTPVISYAQMAQARPNDSELTAKALERSICGAQQASRTADAILRLARGGAADGPRQCDVGAVLDDVAACVPRGTRKAVTLRTLSEPSLIAAINPVALQQIVLNLVLNAMKAVGGRGTVDIRAASRGNDLIIEVEDNGPGVPLDLTPLLFKPFAAQSGYGTGLGLSICEKLAKQVGGEVWLDRAGGPGAKFCVRVPRGTSVNAAAA